MSNTIGCYIILKDDFNNILIERKGKKSDKTWKCIGRLKKGRETDEKCISNSVKEDLNTLVFDLENLDEIQIDTNSDDIIKLYSGKIKEYINLGKNVNEISWINERTFENYLFSDIDKKILLKYFKNIK
ncbi:DNA mismatch repair protein MutT [Clostridium sp.]|uniref:DNA mismatch repair protein MutT n=1 Tax=Clostridium sp. TaxID=1506 RepID=UPI0026DB2AC8|nr:DNA mismatch repair protein MutT [Clostridium sp.]MDO5038248.1 DNA mismatch repair protein MutT [Clostridium sp.]